MTVQKKILDLTGTQYLVQKMTSEIPVKISDLQDDVDMLTSHEDLHLENLPNESPNIRFINNSPQITWNEHVYYDPATTVISGPSYEFDDETSLTSKSKIGYTNSSNSQNTIEHIYGQTYGTTKSFFTMKYYYGSNEKNAEEDESCTINSSLVFTLDPNYESAGADTYYDESNAYSDVSPNNENYFLGRYRPFKEIRAKDFMIALNGYDFSLSSGFDDIYTHTEDTDIHVTSSDKTTWNTVTSKANDSDVVHKSGVETVGGKKTFTDDITASKNASNMAIYLQNLSYDPKTNGQSGIEGKSCGINFLTSTGDSYTNISAYGLSERTLLRLTNWYFTDSQNVDYDSVEFSIYRDGARSFRPRNTSNCDLGESNKKWKGVYATNYYYGSNNVEFSTKFVTTDTNQTITGNKTFSGDLLVYNSDTTAYANYLNLKNQRNARGSSETGVQGIQYQDKNGKSLTMLESRVISNGNTGFNIICYNTDGNNQSVSDGVSVIKSPTTTNFAPTTDNAVTCGRALAKWSGVYSTEYYYGANNTPFTDKFVTTDTNQTISGEKIFSSRPIIYNASATVQADVPNLTFKNPLVERASTTLEGEQTILFTDKNNSNIASIQAKTYTSGISDIILTSYSEYDGVKTTGIMIRRTPTTSKLQGYSDNITDLGDTNRRWRRVYATNYYYGSNNVEFSTKFVTTDTAQTITGVKTFSDNISTKKIISNVAQLQINARSSADSVAVIAGADASNGGGFWAYGKDSGVGSGCRLQIYNTSKSRYERVDLVGSQFLPSPSGEIDCGSTSNKWKTFNGLNPSSLGMPDLDNGIDISSYITVVANANKESLYTPTVNGWISVALTRTGGANMAVMLKQGNFASSGHNIAQENGTTSCNAMLPVKGGVQVSINSALADGIEFAYFYPCLGNV